MRLVRWKEDDGDETFALDWPIDQKSMVWEIGGYEGRWAKQVWDKFQPHIHIYEPQDWAWERIRPLFEDVGKVMLHEYGLWTHDCRLPMTEYETDGASVVKRVDYTKNIYFAPLRSIDKHALIHNEIDLTLMNIEGGEYVLLPYLIGTGLIKRFKYFWAQFHLFADPGGARLNRIREGMARTHNLLWDAGTTAIAWERRW